MDPGKLLTLVFAKVHKMQTKFSREVKEIISVAREEALRLENDFIAPGHFILAILTLQQ